MYIRGRQSEIGVQGSRHQVTSCNERARIDVGESQGNEDDDDDDATRWERKGVATRVKRQGKEMKKRSGRSRVSNSAMAITSLLLRVFGLSKAKYNYRLLREAWSSMPARARARAWRTDCSYLRSPRNCACYGCTPWRAAKSKHEIVLVWLTARKCDVRVEMFLLFATISVFLNKDRRRWTQKTADTRTWNASDTIFFRPTTRCDLKRHTGFMLVFSCSEMR